MSKSLKKPKKLIYISKPKKNFELYAITKEFLLKKLFTRLIK